MGDVLLESGGGYLMNKNPAITEATRNAFLEAFCRLCAKKPVGKITIKEITAKAGYNRCTFYQYFRDVYDLLAYIEDEVIARITDNVTAHVIHKSMTEAFVLTFRDIHKDDELYYDVLMKPENNANFSEKLKRSMAPLLIKKLGLRPDEIRTAYMAEIYLSGIMAAVSRWVRNGRDMPAENLAALIREVSLRGFGMAETVKSCK